MKNDEIKKNYLKKIKIINNYNKNYYEKSKPIVSDAEFDKLKFEILDLEKRYVFLRWFRLSGRGPGQAPPLRRGPGRAHIGPFWAQYRLLS